MTHPTSQEATSFASDTDQVAARQTWMALLARSKLQMLEDVWANLDVKPEYAVLRAPETGMVMVRARAGGNGGQFNMGEMTVTRCVVRTQQGHMGHSYIAGRDKRHAMLAAVFDALMQEPARRKHIETQLLSPIRLDLAQDNNAVARKVAATRVDFFTLVRGND